MLWEPTRGCGEGPGYVNVMAEAVKASIIVRFASRTRGVQL